MVLFLPFVYEDSFKQSTKTKFLNSILLNLKPGENFHRVDTQCTPKIKTTSRCDSQSFNKQSYNTTMTSFNLPIHRESKQCDAYVNPDMCTSAGVVATTYSKFKTNFWIDRILLLMLVWIPITKAVILILLHIVIGVAHCLPETARNSAQTTSGSTFVDRTCGLQLTSDVLRGSTKHVPTSLKSPVENHYKSEIPHADINSLRLQHECFPFVLIIFGIMMWIPHYLYCRSVDRTVRRDLCLVRSELHSFRKAVARELAYLQTIAGSSIEACGPTKNVTSTVSTIPQPGTSFPLAPTHNHHGVVQDGGSGQTTAATVGAVSPMSHTPAPTVIHANYYRQQFQHQQYLTTGGVRCEMVEGPTDTAMVPPYSHGDADLSAPGLLDLPCFHACHADWSLNMYLSAWQNTEFYWIRYLTKHTVLAVFQLCAVIVIFTIMTVYKGAPFSALFICQLRGKDTDLSFVCMLQTTFIINISTINLGFMSLTGLILQAVYFYNNFVHSFWIFGNGGEYMGVTNRPVTFITGVNENGRCFFADYIRLLAYTAFRDTRCEIRTLSVTYAPSLYRSDFHFISLLCIENSHLIPDSIHIHFWTERYARITRRRFRRPYWAIRRGSLGHLVRCEDLSMKFNFSKIKLRVEVNDFGF